MDDTLFAARQPIFDRHLRVFGYELLFRSGPENFFAHHDGEEASSQVINTTLLGLGLDSLTAGKLAFVNITRGVLVDGLYTLLPRSRAVVELLETVEPDDEVLEACRTLKRQGYRLALDDFTQRPGYGPLVELADILKIDFMTADRRARAAVVTRHAGPKRQLVAEKVETLPDYREGLELGYAYFQGYFFCRPEMVSGRDVPAQKTNYLRFLQEVLRPELDFTRLEQEVKREVALSVRLLRYLNSAGFGWRHDVTSVEQALRLLGEHQTRKWASLVVVSELADDRPPELVVTSLVRARFCELAAGPAGLPGRELDLFLVGLLSTIDAILGRPREEVLAPLALADDVRGALLQQITPLGRVLEVVKAAEAADWNRLERLAAEAGLPEDCIPSLYASSVQWATEVGT